MTSFNGALEELRCERLKLEADLKTTDLRKLVLVQELRLLKEFEKNDITLASPDPNPYPYPHPNPNPKPNQVGTRAAAAGAARGVRGVRGVRAAGRARGEGRARAKASGDHR